MPFASRIFMSTGQVGTIFAKLGVSSLFHRSDVKCFHVLWYESAAHFRKFYRTWVFHLDEVRGRYCLVSR
jgi:hypothetical protein